MATKKDTKVAKTPAKKAAAPKKTAEKKIAPKAKKVSVKEVELDIQDQLDYKAASQERKDVVT